VTQFRCRTCSHNVSVAAHEEDLWQDNSCLRFSCRGRYTRETTGEDYYGHLYATGDVQRIFTAEHTGLLKREKRENLEERFMVENSFPGSPNLLSCTPTLEMGIDIGNLSSIILCSVPPAQANYMQRVGRSGRKNGNSFNFTVANGRSHDLYFYEEPKEMITGSIDPPGCFLDAPAVLERQMTAFCFDSWVESGIPVTALPDRFGQVLANLGDPGNKKKFPFNFIQYVELNRSRLLENFQLLFLDSLTEGSREHLHEFVYGDGKEDGQGLIYRIIARLNSIHKERSQLRKRVQKLNQLIKEKEGSPIKDQNYEREIDDLFREKAALNGIIRGINEKDTYNFFTDEGLLPNYAFPEAGIVLQSIIYKKKPKPDGKGKYSTATYEYERPAVSAIHELAPDNHFYAEGRKVKVDQVNLSLSEIEDWRFCNSCSHMELAVTGDKFSTCPSCGSVLWNDEGQKRRMIRMRQVMATTSDQASRIQDDSDEREPEFFHKQMLLDMAGASVDVAFKVSDDQFPFGVEFARNVTFREMNFGKKNNTGETIMIAGWEIPKHGFAICRSCGKVQGGEKPIHTMTCGKKDADQEKNILNFLYLYREFTSEALRILLPAAPHSWSDRKIHSFTAAFYLGLKKRFAGNIDHLRATLHEEPSPDHQYRKRYLVLYDMVPGGTGYLKELMQNEKPLMDVFQMALDALKACGCNQDSEKDGCYRCLYAYRNNYERNNTSRDTAVEVLSEILKYRDRLVKTDSLKNLKINPLLDSELEGLFIEALRSYRAEDIKVALRQEVFKGKPGWYLKVNEQGYFIVPQVELGPAEGVVVPSRADFIFYPELSRNPEMNNENKPVVVFTDGFMYHAEKGSHIRIGKDLSQRMAIVRSGRYVVWSLSWDDVENSIHKKGDYCTNFLDAHGTKIKQLIARFDDLFKVKSLGGIPDKTSMDMLMMYLACPERRRWEMYALTHGLAHLDHLCMEKDVHASVDGLWEDAPWQEIQSETKPDKTGNHFSGHFQKNGEDSPLIKMITYIGKDDYGANRFRKICVLCRFFDEDELAEKTCFKSAWNGFIRMYNIYQFIPDAVFITSKGISEGHYLWLMTDEVKQEEHIREESGSLAALREVTAANVHPLLMFLSTHGLPLPEAGFELCDEKDEIIATAELGWPDQKIAFLRDDEKTYEQSFLARGWQTAELDAILTDPTLCLPLLSSM